MSEKNVVENLLFNYSRIFLSKISVEWSKYMKTFIEEGREFFEANDKLIEEYEEKLKFCGDKIEEELETSKRVQMEFFKSKDKKRKTAIPQQLADKWLKYLTLLDMFEKTKDIAQKNKIEKELEKLKSFKEMYLQKLEEHKEAIKEWKEKERVKEKFVEYYENTPYTKRNYNKIEKTLNYYKNIRDYNYKIVFDDARKIKVGFENYLKSEQCVVEFVKMLKKICNDATNGSFRYMGGKDSEFSFSTMEDILNDFINRMEKHDFGINFAKNSILDYNFDIKSVEKVKINFEDISFKKMSSAIFTSFYMDLRGEFLKSLNEFSEKYKGKYKSLDETVGDSEGGRTMTYGDVLSENNLDTSVKVKIENDRVDDSTKKLYDRIKNTLKAKKGELLVFILKVFRQKMDRKSVFYQPSERIKKVIEEAIVEMLDNIEEELSNNRYVNPRLKDMIIDSIGGFQNRRQETLVVNVIRSVVKYFMLKEMIENLEKTFNNGEDIDDATDMLLVYLKKIKHKTVTEIKTASKKEDEFEKPSEVAEKLIKKKASALTENKVDFLIENKKQIDKDKSKSNRNIQVTPLRTQHDYGYA